MKVSLRQNTIGNILTSNREAMKKIFYYLSFTALTLAACQGEEQAFLTPAEDVKAKPEKMEMSFTAELADNAGTRTELMDGKKVRWTVGDQITVLGTDDAFETPHYRADFTTDKTGYSVVFKGETGTTSDYYAVYPAASFDNIYTVGESPDHYFLMKVPYQQEAIANTFADDLNVLYAHSTALKGATLTFKNVNALIKFQLDGSAVGSISKVRFYPEPSMGQTPGLTGDVFVKINDGTVYDVWNSEAYIELAGDFEASTPYYMVAAPADLPNGFSMTFIDDEGKEFVKYALNGTQLKAGNILNLGTINVETSDFVSSGGVTVYSASSRAKAVPLVVIAEGYTSSELPLFKQQATKMLNFFFSVEPYKQYKDYFNVYIIEATSTESGADVTDLKINKNTYFDAGWASDSYGDMKANDTKVYSFVKEHCPDIVEGKATIEQTPIIMLVNDTRYGGICHSISNGQGYCIVPTTQNADTKSEALYWETNHGSWINTALHEGGGHCFGRLGDEYWYASTSTYPYSSISSHTWEVPFSMNLTVNKNNPQWSMMIPSVQGAVENGKFPYVGTYEGGEVYAKSIWRSEEISCMTDNRAYFSAWQRYLIVQRIFSIVGETFSYEIFLANDKQYADIQNARENAGREGLKSTIYNGLNPTFNSSGAPRNHVEKPVEPMPPLASPVLQELKEPKKTVVQALD